MNKPLIVFSYCVDGMTLDFCLGEILDIYRTSRFAPIQKYKLPDEQGRTKEFEDWLLAYRNSSGDLTRKLLEEAVSN